MTCAATRMQMAGYRLGSKGMLVMMNFILTGQN